MPRSSAADASRSASTTRVHGTGGVEEPAPFDTLSICERYCKHSTLVEDGVNHHVPYEPDELHLAVVGTRRFAFPEECFVERPK